MNARACVEAHMVAVVLARHQSVVVLTLMFSCVDQKLSGSESAGTQRKRCVPKLNI